MRRNIILKQKMMNKVLIGLLPITLASVYLFGWRSLNIILTCNIVGFITEYIFVRRNKKPVSEAVFVSSTLLALSLPPSIPIFIAIIGTIFGITFGKMVFGGFGRNIFNPALTGRAFIYVSFGNYMTSRWNHSFYGIPGGFSKYFPQGIDSVTSATPGMLIRQGGDFSWQSLLLGNTSGTIGGTTAVLAIIGGLYLLYTKTANYRIILSALIAFIITQGLFHQFSIQNAAEPIPAILSGSVLLGIFFYATDPVTSAQTNIGRWIYGSLIGFLTVIITNLSDWPEGTMFAILLGNMFAPLIDYIIKEIKANNEK